MGKARPTPRRPPSFVHGRGRSHRCGAGALSGSYVDLAPSFVWPLVTYVDIDRRAGQFFGDQIGVQELLVEHGVGPNSHSVRFISADYTDLLDLDEGEFDLLISLYAGFVSDACTCHLRVGGTLLVNPSHGDAAMASIDPRYRLHAVVTSRSGNYAVADSRPRLLSRAEA